MIKDQPTRLLVIDDSLTTIAMIRRAFAQSEYIVDALNHVLEVPSYIREAPPDLIVLDLIMPMLPGEKVSDIIRQTQRRDIPILIYSAAPSGEIRAAAERAQAVGWVSKQVSIDKLVIRVKRIINRRRRHPHST